MSRRESNVTPSHNVLRILWGAILATLIIYGVVAEIVALKSQPQIPHLPWILGGVAALMALALPLLRGQLMPEKKSGSEPLPEELGDEARAAIGRYFTAQIVSWAMSESIAIFGLVCAILLGEPVYFYPFAAGTLVLMLLLAPRRSDFEAVVRAAKQPAQGS